MIEITPAAFDQASNRVRGIWLESRIPAHGGEGEGLYSWLQRMGEEALEKGERLESGKFRWAGMKFNFLPICKHHSDSFNHDYLLQGIERVR